MFMSNKESVCCHDDYFLSTADSIRSNDDLMSLKLGCYSTMLSADRAPTPKHIFRPHS